MDRLIKSNLQDISDLETKMANLRAKWTSVDAQQFTFNQEDTCPTCGQSLPQDKLTEAREHAQSEFNRIKADQLESITADGKQAKQGVEALQAEVAAINAAIEQVRPLLTEAEKNITALQNDINTMINNAGDVTQDQSYIAKLAEKEAIEKDITALRSDTSEARQKVKEEIVSLTTKMRALEATKAELAEYKRGQNRIAELSEQERELAAEYEKLEGELYLTEQFIRAKVSLLEDKINSRFKLARFKLFDVQINGGVNECCETTYKGVPYSSGLNNGHRNAVGMDIINTLSEHYGFYPPIFVDNAESVTVLPEMEAQVIRLVVSERDKALRVEIDGEQINLFKEAI